MKKIEGAIKKLIFMCNKELEYKLPERLQGIEMARISYNEHRLAPHRADLTYLEAMQRTFTSAQVNQPHMLFAKLNNLYFRFN